MLAQARAPAPRGQYPRGVDRTLRASEQRAWILLTLARALRSPATTSLAQVSKLGGFGRNTFYAHFPTFDAAVDALMQAIGEGLESLLVLPPSSRTPVAQLHAFAASWGRAMGDWGGQLGALFSDSAHPSVVRQRELARSGIRQVLAALWQRGSDAGMFSPRLIESRLEAAAAALETLSRTEAAESTDTPADAIAEVLLRLLR